MESCANCADFSVSRLGCVTVSAGDLRSSEIRGTTGPLVLGALGVGFVLVRPPHALVRLVARAVPQVLFLVATDERRLALTIDDGPHPETTPAILDVLAAYRARATFFLIGHRARERPDLVERIAIEGHELGNHGFRERASAALSPAELDADLDRTHAALAPFGPVALFRPGSGWVTPRVLRAAARHGYRCVLGSVYPHDPHIRRRRYVVWDVLRRARPGAIVILHEGRADRAGVARALDEILSALGRHGYEVTTVTALLEGRAGANRAA
jgi:peptidoglycan-N-acetylglucosamine deacetylase